MDFDKAEEVKGNDVPTDEPLSKCLGTRICGFCGSILDFDGVRMRPATVDELLEHHRTESIRDIIVQALPRYRAWLAEDCPKCPS